MKRLTQRLAQTIAAIAIALFWSISAVGTTVGTTLGVTTLATAINAVTSTQQKRASVAWASALARPALGSRKGTVTPTIVVVITPTAIPTITIAHASAFGSAFKSYVSVQP